MGVSWAWIAHTRIASGFICDTMNSMFHQNKTSNAMYVRQSTFHFHYYWHMAMQCNECNFLSNMRGIEFEKKIICDLWENVLLVKFALYLLACWMLNDHLPSLELPEASTIISLVPPHLHVYSCRIACNNFAKLINFIWYELLLHSSLLHLFCLLHLSRFISESASGSVDASWSLKSLFVVLRMFSTWLALERSPPTPGHPIVFLMAAAQLRRQVQSDADWRLSAASGQACHSHCCTLCCIT